MDNLSRFYLELSINAAKLQAFNFAPTEQKHAMLREAGVENAEKIMEQNEEAVRKTLASNLIASTGKWQGVETNAGNTDNRDNSFSIQKQTH